MDLQAQLVEKTAELEALKKTYEEYMESSLALEKELEDSLNAAEENAAVSAKKKAAAEEKLSFIQEKYSQCCKDVSQLQAEVLAAQGTIAALEKNRKLLESTNCELAERVRILESTEETLQHKLSKAEEAIIMLDIEIDEMRADFIEKEKMYKTELTELQAEISQLESGVPFTASNTIQENNTCRDSPANMDVENPAALNTLTSDIDNTRSVDAAAFQASIDHKNLQEELIRELELEVEFLNTKLAAAEEQNVLLNDEISRMSDELIAVHEGNKQTIDDHSGVSRSSVPHSTTSINTSHCSPVTDDQQSFEQLQGRLDSISEQLRIRTEELEDMRLERDSKVSVLSVLEDNVRELSDQVATKVQEVVAVTAVADLVKSNYEQQIANMHVKLEEADDQLRRMKVENGELLARLEEMRRDVELSRTEWEREKAELLITIDVWKKRVHVASAQTPKIQSDIIRVQSPSRTGSVTPSRRTTFLNSPFKKDDGRGADYDDANDLVGNLISKSISPDYRAQLGVGPGVAVTPGRKGMTRLDSLDNTINDQFLVDSRSSAAISAEKALICNDVVILRHEIQSQLQLIDALRTSNAKLLQKLQAARGNILVACRTRPPSESELSKHRRSISVVNGTAALATNNICVDIIDDNELTCYDTRSEVWRSFVFDRIWPMHAKQADIFADVEPLIMSVVDGYNCCLFAYGQTGSGKTYTMNGFGDQYGVSYRAMHRLFELLNWKQAQARTAESGNNSSLKLVVPINQELPLGHTTVDANSISDVDISPLTPAAVLSEQLSNAGSDSQERSATEDTSHDMDSGDGISRDGPSNIPADVSFSSHVDVVEPFRYEVRVSMMEIYNDQVIDLLATHGSMRNLDIRQAPDGTVHVPDLIQVKTLLLYLCPRLYYDWLIFRLLFTRSRT